MPAGKDWDKAVSGQSDPAAVARIDHSVSAQIEQILRRNDISQADVARGLTKALETILTEMPVDQRAATVLEIQQTLLRQPVHAANDFKHS